MTDDPRPDPEERPRPADEAAEDEETPPPPIAPDERIADGPAGATEARTPGMGD